MSTHDYAVLLLYNIKVMFLHSLRMFIVHLYYYVSRRKKKKKKT